MQTYTLIKQFAVGCATVMAFSFFFMRCRRLIDIMKSVRGKHSMDAGHLSDRIRTLLTDVLGQGKVRRKFPVGLAHTFAFFGFIAVQPHTIELLLQGVFPSFHLADFSPTVAAGYMFAADILAALVIPGLGYAIYRRVFIQPSYLTDGRDARLILFFTFVIIVSFHFVNAFRSLQPQLAGGLEPATVYPISDLTASLFGLTDLSVRQQVVGYEAAYWIHILTILGFLVYIPGSKHLHLLAAAPNVALKPRTREKAMIVTDIEDENAERFGLGDVSDLNWKTVLDLYACTECGRCEEQCPASASGKPLSPKSLVSGVKHDLFDQSDKLLMKDFESVSSLVGEPPSAVSPDALWSCTTCRACEAVCPVNIQHLDMLLEMRKQRVLMEADFPAELQGTFTCLENQSNPWGFTDDTRGDWCKKIDVALMTDKPDADILWYVGCAGSFDDRGKQISQALARVLKRAGVDFAILGPEERCNGDAARRAGNEYLAQMMIQENIATFERYKPKKILTACPHCYNMLKNEYPAFGATYPVIHHSELLFDLHRQGRLIPNGTQPAGIAFHDSCYLGRWNGIFDPPRELLRSISGGASLLEMGNRREQGFCCGAGGARMFMEETLGTRINRLRAQEASKTGASVLAASCPFCVTMLSDGLKDIDAAVEVRDIAEIVDAATA